MQIDSNAPRINTPSSPFGCLLLFFQKFTLAQLYGAILRLPIWDDLTGKAVPINTDIASSIVNNVYGDTQTAFITNATIAAMNAETPATQGNCLACLAASAANQSHLDLVWIQSTYLATLALSKANKTHIDLAVDTDH